MVFRLYTVDNADFYDKLKMMLICGFRNLYLKNYISNEQQHSINTSLVKVVLLKQQDQFKEFFCFSHNCKQKMPIKTI